MSDKTRLTTFCLPASVVEAMVELAQDTNVSVNTVVTAALEQFLNRADRQADIEQARRAFVDAHARHVTAYAAAFDADEFIASAFALKALLEREETP